MKLAFVKPEKIKSMREELKIGGEYLNFYRHEANGGYNFKPEEIEEVGDDFSHSDIPELIPDNQDKPSFDNALKVHNFIKNAVDNHRYCSAQEGFWVYLTHVIFPDYVRRRFVPSSDDEKFFKQINRYWFVGEQTFSNAIYRFYLIIEMTAQFESEVWFTGRRHSYLDYSRLVCRLADFKMIFQHRATRSGILLFSILECLRDLENKLAGTRMPGPKALGKYDIHQMMNDISLILPVRNLQMMNPDRQLIPEIRKIIIGLADKNYNYKTPGIDFKLRHLKAAWL